MRDFKEIIVVLKKYLANEKEMKIYDKSVSELLCMSQAQFATLKRRNSTPYINILEFCKREGLCCSEIFFD